MTYGTVFSAGVTVVGFGILVRSVAYCRWTAKGKCLSSFRFGRWACLCTVYSYCAVTTVNICVCVCVCSYSRYNCLCTHTFLLSSLAQPPSTTRSVVWAQCSSSCIHWSTTTGRSTQQTAAVSCQRALVSTFTVHLDFYFFSSAQTNLPICRFAVQHDLIQFSFFASVNSPMFPIPLIL